MKVYKATNKDMQCTPNGKIFQYEQGVTYEKPEAELYRHGFHACEAPMDVLRYYSPADGSRYFEAELEDISPERESEDTKVCGKKITIGAEIGIPGLAKAHVEYVKQLCDKATEQTASGERGNAAASGESGNAAAYGVRGTAAASGFYGSAEANGEQTVAIAWGVHSKARGKIGSYIVCAEYDDENKTIKAARLGLIDGETLKPDTWYSLKGGEFLEVSE